ASVGADNRALLESLTTALASPLEASALIDVIAPALEAAIAARAAATAEFAERQKRIEQLSAEKEALENEIIILKTLQSLSAQSKPVARPAASSPAAPKSKKGSVPSYAEKANAGVAAPGSDSARIEPSWADKTELAASKPVASKQAASKPAASKPVASKPAAARPEHASKPAPLADDEGFRPVGPDGKVPDSPPVGDEAPRSAPDWRCDEARRLAGASQRDPIVFTTAPLPSDHADDEEAAPTRYKIPQGAQAGFGIYMGMSDKITDIDIRAMKMHQRRPPNFARTGLRVLLGKMTDDAYGSSHGQIPDLTKLTVVCAKIARICGVWNFSCKVQEHVDNIQDLIDEYPVELCYICYMLAPKQYKPEALKVFWPADEE
ncbi:MAG: hypothetical protein EBU84_20595, partial [Actinobacteria bacterium]|nr:hypothetical protein [Actinomycetota bacterium]